MKVKTVRQAASLLNVSSGEVQEFLLKTTCGVDSSIARNAPSGEVVTSRGSQNRTTCGADAESHLGERRRSDTGRDSSGTGHHSGTEHYWQQSRQYGSSNVWKDSQSLKFSRE
mmetsp:Transcript_48305/g.87267  ORF Transcript_48305/g.87267 Transcript_48305/m.87267 type:complete len:113 (-) Transcript_48305:34-372(-)